MGDFYFDESIHERAGFILGAYAYSQSSPEDRVSAALKRAGLRPGFDEFKSGAHMATNPAQARARDELFGIVQQCRLGVVVDASRSRSTFGAQALRGLHKILTSNDLVSIPHRVYFDRGLFRNIDDAIRSARDVDLPASCELYFEQDSTMILGLQLADLAAHTCATMLLEQLGYVTKVLKAGDNSGYEPDTDIELGFELWATIRYNFFAAPPPDPDTWESQLDFQVDVASRGLYIADTCDSVLSEAALARFGRMYVGCVH